MPADLLIKNCRIHTLWDRMPVADAMAVGDSKVMALGPDALDLIGPGTKVLDLEGSTVVPGFIDSHNHLVDYGTSLLRSASLLGSRSITEIIDRLKCHREANGVGDWVLGHCFDQELMVEKRFPTREDLDKVFGDTPVLITRVCGHAIVVSSNILNRISEKLPENERRTGVLTEGRAWLAWQLIPSLAVHELKQAAMAAACEARSKGLTGVHVIVGGWEEFEALKQLRAENTLPVRVYAMVPPNLYKELASEGLKTGSGDEWFRIGAVKLFMDGSMGARTAAMKKDFSDDPGNRGELIITADELAAEVSQIQEAGFHAAVHAIGDLAVEEAVEGIARALGGRDNRVIRHRIEHASIMTESSLDRMALLNIIASVQPQFVVSDFWTIDRVGKDRYRYAYPFKSMVERGITLAMGSDCPVEIINPLQLIYRAVTRDVYSPQESLDVSTAIKAYCIGSAYASFEENIKGSLQPGKFADFVVLMNDIFDCDVESMEHINVRSVFIGGQAAV